VDTNPATSGRLVRVAASASSVVIRSTSTTALGAATWSGPATCAAPAQAGTAPDKATTTTSSGTRTQRIPAS
jgi:hypothetical protein